MIIGKINVGMSFEDGIPRWVKCDIDATPEPGETPQQVLDQIKDVIEGWHQKNNPHLNLDAGFGPGATAPPATQQPVINRAHERLLIEIENAKTSQKLLEYEKQVDDSGDQNLRIAFALKFKDLKRLELSQKVSLP